MRALLVASSLLLLAATAQAYPQFQLSTGATRCNQCHYAPAGGGLINNYGREESADTVSRGGNGDFLHGLWDPPKWLALGGDVRGAGLFINEGADEGGYVTAFPMQFDLYARAEVGPFSLYLNGGFRGAARPDTPAALARLVSREHYLMYRPKPQGLYVRAGRFFAPYGLRLAEHPSYVRRFLGFNTLEETYNLSGGWVEDDWELHATAFIPDFIYPVGERASGAAVYFEKRLGRHAAAGAEARVGISDESTRAQGGFVGKYFLEKPGILFLGQIDLVHQGFDDFDAPRWQVAGYLGASWMFARGYMAQVSLERWDEDLSVKGVARDAVALQLQYFPFAHLEVSLYGRLQLIGTGPDHGSPSEVILLQVHYYL